MYVHSFQVIFWWQASTITWRPSEGPQPIAIGCSIDFLQDNEARFNYVSAIKWSIQTYTYARATLIKI